MKVSMRRAALCIGMSALAFAGHAQAQTVPAESDAANVTEIVVTAQKREQSVNKVGMSITAASGDELVQRGVSDARDLVKVVSGFTYTESNQGSPVYTLRGIGLNDSGLSSVPSVAVYTDQISLPYPIMTGAVNLDLERVEVLKGPQGTLFGQNSTGGAINYIAAKPTRSFKAGFDGSVDNFGRTDVSAFVSGPLGDNVRARLAVRSVQGGQWQRHSSFDAQRGAERKLQGRLTLDADLGDNFDIRLTATAWKDTSDTQASQLVATWVGGPASAGIPGLPGGASSPLLVQPLDALKSDARAAAWSLDYPSQVDNRFLQAALVANYHVTPDVTITSLTSYSDMKYRAPQDTDGTAVQNLELTPFGTIKHFSQELRVAYDTDRFHGLIGGTYDHSDVTDRIDYRFEGTSIAYWPFLPNRLSMLQSTADQTHKTLAAFANAEYEVADNLSLVAGIRFTNAKVNGFGCTYDTSTNQAATALLSFFSGYPIAPRACYLIDDTNFGPPGGRNLSLDENSTSWKLGANYTLSNGGLLYGSFSRGYKGGVIPNISATTKSQLDPATQERVDAYEAGFKLPLLDRALQINGAAFYYDYKDKQVRGRVLTQLFGLLEKLINVPSSRIIGQELTVVARPTTGLTLSGSVTHLDSKISGNFVTFNGRVEQGNIKGARLPYTPEWTGNVDADYRWGLSNKIEAYLGAGVTFASKSGATFQTAALPAPEFTLPGRALLDLRGGITDANGRWTVEVFGKNVTNKYYFDTMYFALDTLTRFAGRPATFGLRVSLRN